MPATALQAQALADALANARARLNEELGALSICTTRGFDGFDLRMAREGVAHYTALIERIEARIRKAG